MAERGKLGEGMDQRAEKGQGVERGKGIEQDQSIDLLRQDQGEEKDQCVDQDRGVMRGLDVESTDPFTNGGQFPGPLGCLFSKSLPDEHRKKRIQAGGEGKGRLRLEECSTISLLTRGFQVASTTPVTSLTSQDLGYFGEEPVVVSCGECEAQVREVLRCI